MVGRMGGRYRLNFDQIPKFKNPFFSLQIGSQVSEAHPHRPTMYAKIRPPIRPSIFAPHHAPPLIALPVASKMWVFHENDGNS